MEVVEATEEFEEIIRKCHDPQTEGHMGITKTLMKVKSITTWPRIKQDVTEYIAKCQVCAKAKHVRQPRQGQHQAIAAPEYPFQRPALDFITGLPEADDPATGRNCDMIMTIIDGLTKYAKFIPYRTDMDAKQLAYIWAKEVYADHGVPEKIVSDRDKLFIAKFTEGINEALGTEGAKSTAFHPQTDGQTERMNQTLEQYLRIYASENKERWTQLLPSAMMAINNAYNEDIKTSPTEMLYGRSIRIPEVKNQTCHAAQQFVNGMQRNWATAKERIDKARQAIQERLSAKRRPVTVVPGDKVLVHTRNMTTDKLDTPYAGPYEVVGVKGTTVHLSLPETKTYPKFHASLIKKAPSGMPLCKTWNFSKKDEYEVERIIGEKQIDNKTHFLVQWKDYDISESTWEPRENLNNARAMLRQFRKAT